MQTCASTAGGAEYRAACTSCGSLLLPCRAGCVRRCKCGAKGVQCGNTLGQRCPCGGADDFMLYLRQFRCHDAAHCVVNETTGEPKASTSFWPKVSSRVFRASRCCGVLLHMAVRGGQCRQCKSQGLPARWRAFDSYYCSASAAGAHILWLPTAEWHSTAAGIDWLCHSLLALAGAHWRLQSHAGQRH